jgi:acyl-coenzyme A thioesterase PaaI-like protein
VTVANADAFNEDGKQHIATARANYMILEK